MTTIRPATPDDLPAILDITNDVIATSTAIYFDDPLTLDAPAHGQVRAEVGAVRIHDVRCAVGFAPDDQVAPHVTT